MNVTSLCESIGGKKYLLRLLFVSLFVLGGCGYNVVVDSEQNSANIERIRDDLLNQRFDLMYKESWVNMKNEVSAERFSEGLTRLTKKMVKLDPKLEFKRFPAKRESEHASENFSQLRYVGKKARKIVLEFTFMSEQLCGLTITSPDGVVTEDEAFGVYNCG